MDFIMSIFYVFAKPMSMLLFWLYGLVGDYGIAIIIFTLLVRLILFPLYNSQMKQSAKMTEFQPELQKLQKQYGHDKEKYNQKVMEFYQQSGYNPAKGCLPLLIQMPILFGLFAALRSPLDYYEANTEAILAIHQSFLWIPDLSQPDKWILPILAGITTFFSYRITMGANPQSAGSMKVLSYIFPLMILWWGRSFPAGLTLYWFVGTLFMCVQQKIVLTKLKKDREKKAAQEQYEKEHPELFVKEEPEEEVVEEEIDDYDAYDEDEIESIDDYSDFYTEEELAKMRQEKKNNQPKKKKKK